MKFSPLRWLPSKPPDVEGSSNETPPRPSSGVAPPASDSSSASTIRGSGSNFNSSSDFSSPVSGIRFPVSPDPRSLPPLYHLSSLAARTDDPHTALREMLDLFVSTFRADAGSIGLLSPDTGRIETEVQTENIPA